jgi:hypothetical protein
MICHNWGCDQEFFSDRNEKKECRHHPGAWQFGSEQGLWPAGWTCCRKQWDEEGCAFNLHRGYPKNADVKMCLNHGACNKVSRYPDSFCGKPFIKGGDDSCKTHSGSFRVKKKATGDGVWTCCGAEERTAEGCNETEHRSAEWPEEDA